MCTYRADPPFGLPRLLPETTWLLLVDIHADDRQTMPKLHDLWAYTDHIGPPTLEPRWSEDKQCRGEAKWDARVG